MSRPVGLLDLENFEANARDLVQRAKGKPVRVASKSLRVRRAIEKTLSKPGYAGVLAFTLSEALWLAECGIKDIVLGYPCTDVSVLKKFAASEIGRENITLMIDDIEQIEILDRAVPDRQNIRIAIDMDASYRPALGISIGAARSPLRTAADVTKLAVAILRKPRISLVGLMAYEGQIAGVGNAASGAKGTAIRAMQKASAMELRTRRAEAVAALQTLTDLEFVNGGGTGSIESTSSEPAVTEIAAGSGLLGPGLFDSYTHFQPKHALFFGLNVVRRPGPNTVTVLGGGWIASGPPGADRLPTIAWPLGLKYHGTEGPGEVQTPLSGEHASKLRLGDTVYFRHAKSGEPAERLNEIAVYSHGKIIDSWPTYRSEGKAFL
ncbi:alanine racemase [Arthrobacter sp. MYb227]|nr:alanine racemase [Arthrobacter sp. MYb227]